MESSAWPAAGARAVAVDDTTALEPGNAGSECESGIGPTRDDGPDELATLRAIAAELGASDVAAEVASLAERLAEGRFYVACIGQFKRGKSSLINALVGSGVLPTGIVPVTAVPTVLRYGPRLRARVRLDARWLDIAPDTLERYVAEERNPENALGVQAVELCVNSPVLAGGLCLVDTPGIGSVFEGNTAAARDFLPQVDAAMVVLGVDPPLTRDELDMIETVAAQAPSLILVLNKADRFRDEERARSIEFAERVLSARLGRPVGRVFEVSATERRAAAHEAGAPERDWSALVRALQTLAADSGRSLVESARTRGVARLAGICLAEIGVQRDALRRPIADSERRLEALERAIGDAAHRALRLGHLFNAEQQVLGRDFAARRASFLERAIPAAAAELDAVITATPSPGGPALRARALAAARTVGQQWVEPWLAAEQRDAEAAYGKVADHFIAVANDFLSAVRRDGGEYLDRLPATIDNEAGFRVESRYYFRQLHPLVYGSPVRTALDILRPPRRTLDVVRRDARKYLEDLLSMNTTLVQNDLDQRVTESRRRLEARIQELLRSVYVAVERALDRARAAHAAGEQSVVAALARLAELSARIESIRDTAA